MIKKCDIFIILFAILTISFSVYTAYFNGQDILRVLIRGQGSEWIFPLEATEKIAVSGPLGETIICIGGNMAWVESSPCSNQTCVASGFVKRHGQWTACLPNNVLVVIRNGVSRNGVSKNGALKNGDDVDVIVR